MRFQICYSRRFLIVLLESIVHFSLIAENRTWNLQTCSQNITVESGVESNIDFFLNDYRHLDSDIRIIVYRLRSDKIYEIKCILNHSVTSGCKSEIGPCECVGERSGSYWYRLKMNFTQQNGGLWCIHILNNNETNLNVQVIQSKMTLQRRKSTETSTVTVSTHSINSDSGVIFIVVSTVAIVIVIISILSGILVWCRPRFLPETILQTLAARTEMVNELTEINFEDPHLYNVPDDVEYVPRSSQNPRVT